MLITSDAETISGDKVGSSATAEASGSNAVNSVIVFSSFTLLVMVIDPSTLKKYLAITLFR